MRIDLGKHRTICCLIGMLITITYSLPSFAISDKQYTDVVLQLRWDHQFQFAGYYAADWLGYYNDEGLDVQIRSAFKEGTILAAPEEISQGRADFGVGAADILMAQDAGMDFTLVASIFQRSAVEYCTLKQNRGNTVFDLSRMHIARRPGDLLDLELQALFASEGIITDTVRTSYKTDDFSLEDLTSGNFDVVPEFLGQISYTAAKQGINVKVIKPAEYGVDFYGDTLYTSRALAESNPDLVEKFRRASIKGWYYALENPEKINALIEQRLERSTYSPNIEEELLEFNTYQAQKVLELTHYPIVMVGNINTFRWSQMAEVMHELHLISEVPNMDKMVFDYEQVKMNQLQVTKQNLYINFGFITILITIFFLLYLNRRNILLRKEIYEKQLIEKRLILSNTKYETIFQSSVLGITVTDAEGYIQTVNDAWCRMTGYSADELCEMNIDELIDPEFHDSDQKQLSDLKEGRISSYSLVKKYKHRPSESQTDDYFYGRMVLTRLWNDASETLQTMSMVADITREIEETEANQRSEMRFRKIVGQVAQEIGGNHFENLDLSNELSMDLEEINMELEKLFTHELEENRRKDALIRYQAKMAAMGEMIGSIAHQWRQPLNTLKLVLMNLKDSNGDTDYEGVCYDKANKLIRRMSETIDDFRYFSNPQTEPRYFSVDESIGLVLGLIDEQLRIHGIKLQTDCALLPPIYGLDNQFSHVLFNLLSNAIDALKTNPLTEKRQITIEGSASNTHIVLSIADTGPGIDQEHSEKIFDMYFTTKEADGGSGLGLAMAKSIVENAFNGQLRLLKTQIGCTFEITIPMGEGLWHKDG